MPRSLASIPLPGRGYRGRPDPHASHPAPAALSRTAGRRPPTRRHIRRPPALARRTPFHISRSRCPPGSPPPGRRSGRRLVHTDLHYDNILASAVGQPWAAIDPAAAAGAPERSVAELLWTRADELPGPHAITGLLATIVDHGQLDPAKAVAWGFVRSIDYWLWGQDNGLTSDPLRCERIASALEPAAGEINLPHQH